MRLIASFHDELQAQALYLSLMRGQVESVYEGIKNPQGQEFQYDVWIINEEDIDKAQGILSSFHANQELNVTEDIKKADRTFFQEEKPFPSQAEKEPQKLFPKSVNIPFITRWIISICIIFFVWNSLSLMQLAKKAPSLAREYGLTSLSKNMLYDFPQNFENLSQFLLSHPELDIQKQQDWAPALQTEYNDFLNEPYWKGLYAIALDPTQKQEILSAPWLTKIAKGEYWRTLSPIFLHGNFFHILFNMLWLWLLGKEVERKLGGSRYLFMMGIIALISNFAQYVMSGPFFLGYSGVICGLAAFIWVRERKAPWEGYAVHKSTLLFLILFVFGMLGLQLLSLGAHLLNIRTFPLLQIGNTSHLTGLVCGWILGQVPFFYRLRHDS